MAKLIMTSVVNIVNAIVSEKEGVRVTRREYDGAYELSVLRNDPRFTAAEIAEIGPAFPFPQSWVTVDVADGIQVEDCLLAYYTATKKKVAA